MIIEKTRFKGLQAFKDKSKNDFLIVDLTSSQFLEKGYFDCLNTQIPEEAKTLHSDPINWDYIEENCKPIAWKHIPQEWKNHFLPLLDFEHKILKNSSASKNILQQKQLSLF